MPDVGLFVPCLVDLHRPKVGFATVHLLTTVVMMTRRAHCASKHSADGRGRSAEGAGQEHGIRSDVGGPVAIHR